MIDKPITKASVKLHTPGKKMVIGTTPEIRVVLSAPGNFEITGVKGEIICVMSTPGGYNTRRWKMTGQLPSRNAGSNAKKVILSAKEAFDCPTLKLEKTKISWRMETTISLKHDDHIKPGKRKSAGRKLVSVDGSFPLEVIKKEQLLQLSRINLPTGGTPVYWIPLLFCLALFLPFHWLWTVLSTAGLLISLLYLERSISKQHLLKGLSIQTSTTAKGQHQLIFQSKTDNNDFMEGVVSIGVMEQYPNEKKDLSGALNKTTVRNNIFLKSICLTSGGKRVGRNYYVDIPVSDTPLPPTLTLPLGAGYRWLVSYIYPRKFWWDIRVSSFVEATYLRNTEAEDILDLNSDQPLQKPVLPTREAIHERRIR